MENMLLLLIFDKYLQLTRSITFFGVHSLWNTLYSVSLFFEHLRGFVKIYDFLNSRQRNGLQPAEFEPEPKKVIRYGTYRLDHLSSQSFISK